MRNYLVIYEKTETGYSAYVPDLEGCIATGRTRQEVKKHIQEAVEFHIEGLELEGVDVPMPIETMKHMGISLD
ncbi:MAG: type II toxin-antitoxin system HicB family antitoxin [Saprospiraceae bacterium]|nr:type II toxin-antitoxin system HicB family antitoxin [Saprospiraceae bacterium]